MRQGDFLSCHISGCTILLNSPDRAILETKTMQDSDFDNFDKELGETPLVIIALIFMAALALASLCVWAIHLI